MREQQDWTPADDEVVRGALNTLRLDVEAVPLADVRFVKARGVARRRRAQVVGVALAAAAVAAITFVGFPHLGSNQGLDLPPAAPSATAPSSTNSTEPLAAPGPLLVAAEWQRALELKGTVRLGAMTSGKGVSTCHSPPGTQFAIGFATTASSGFYAVQGTYRAASPDAGDAAAAKAASQTLVCGGQSGPGKEIWKVEADATWPKVFSSVTAGGKSWFIVAHQGALTSLIGLSDPILGGASTEAPHFTLAQIESMALVAQQHLVHEVERGTPR